MYIKSKIEPLTMALSEISAAWSVLFWITECHESKNLMHFIMYFAHFHEIMIRLSRDLQPITVMKMEVMMN